MLSLFMSIAGGVSWEEARVGPYRDRVSVHTERLFNRNDKRFSYTDKGLGSTQAMCARGDLS